MKKISIHIASKEIADKLIDYSRTRLFLHFIGAVWGKDYSVVTFECEDHKAIELYYLGKHHAELKAELHEG